MRLNVPYKILSSRASYLYTSRPDAIKIEGMKIGGVYKDARKIKFHTTRK